MAIDGADLRDLVRVERLGLVEDLETLDEHAWVTPSLCDGWTVQDVAAHLASATAMGPWEMVTGLARKGFRLNRFIADDARLWARRGPEAIIELLRRNAAREARPTGMPWPAVISDAVVHGLDIRRPLGIAAPVAPEAFEAVTDFLTGAGARWPASTLLGGTARQRVEGVTLLVDELGWSYGSGAAVHTDPGTALLVLAGRPVESGALTGPGAARLQ